MNEIFNQIMDEFTRAKKLHPKWPDDPIHQAAIVAEEAGELLRAAIDVRFFGGDIWKMRKEAIQTAAMAVRFLMNFNWGKPKT